MKHFFLVLWIVILILTICFPAFSAYHHEGEKDANKFLEAYPEKAGTKLDHCALCHSGGEYEKKPGKWVELGSCQWCHRTYGYDGAGDITETINSYGAAYKDAGRNADAVNSTADDDSDDDGYSNSDEIAANTFPGDDSDHPGLETAAYRVYTRGQLEAMTQHTQFLLMNTSRSGDFFAQYTGIPIKDLLDDAGILDSAEGITVIAPDGWYQDHPLYYNEDLDMYHVYGDTTGQEYQYPPSTYYYDSEADTDTNSDYGWCDYTAPSSRGRSHSDQIFVEGGLKAILAIQRDGRNLDPGVLNDENKLDGEGPYRVVVPQKFPSPPDQSSTSDSQDVIWPYTEEWDHNAGSCSKSATIIRVDPLPEGTTDIDTLETGWSYIDQGKIIIYGAIDGTDSNGNGILDSEEFASGTTTDFDEDGTPDYQDEDTASPRNPNGMKNIVMHTSNGSFAKVKALTSDAPEVSQTGKPSGKSFPYGVLDFSITDLSSGGTVTVALVFPDNVPEDAEYYKIIGNEWISIPFGSNDGDATITISLTDGDAATDADAQANGVITDPGALAIHKPDGSNDNGACFINTLLGK